MRYLLIIIILVVSFNGFAQDPQLIDNTWYLQNVIIDGDNNFPPSNSEVSNVIADFNEPNVFYTSVCDLLDGILSFGSFQFTFDSSGMTLGGCSLQENTDFQLIYLDTFFVSTINDVFNYSIVDESNGSKTLTITNSSGDEAVYNSVLLSTTAFSRTTASIYPNPVKDELFISVANDEVSIKIFDLNGKLILEREGVNSNKPIEVEKLNNGIYFILFHNKQGLSVIEKFIKY